MSKKDTTSSSVHVSLHTAIFMMLVTQVHVGRTHLTSMVVTLSFIRISPVSTPNVNTLIQIQLRPNPEYVVHVKGVSDRSPFKLASDLVNVLEVR